MRRTFIKTLLKVPATLSFIVTKLICYGSCALGLPQAWVKPRYAYASTVKDEDDPLAEIKRPSLESKFPSTPVCLCSPPVAGCEWCAIRLLVARSDRHESRLWKFADGDDSNDDGGNKVGGRGDGEGKGGDGNDDGNGDGNEFRPLAALLQIYFIDVFI